MFHFVPISSWLRRKQYAESRICGTVQFPWPGTAGHRHETFGDGDGDSTKPSSTRAPSDNGANTSAAKPARTAADVPHVRIRRLGAMRRENVSAVRPSPHSSARRPGLT